MAAVVKATPLTFVVHFLAAAAAVMVLVWCISFRGGVAWDSSNKNLIFNSIYGINTRVRMRTSDSLTPLLARAFNDIEIHPVLMLIGFIILGGEAIVSYKSLPLKKDVKKVIHLVLHAVALILGIVGISAAFKFHNESAILNLYSLHSWLGIGIIVLYGIQWIYGFIIFFYPGGNPNLRAESLPWHVLFGMFVYVLAVANAAIGFLEKLTFLESGGLEKFGPEAFLVNFTAIATVLYGTFVLFTVYAQKDQESSDEYNYSAIESRDV